MILDTLEFGSRIRKTPVVVGNCTGFAVNRVFFPYTQVGGGGVRGVGWGWGGGGGVACVVGVVGVVGWACSWWLWCSICSGGVGLLCVLPA